MEAVERMVAMAEWGEVVMVAAVRATAVAAMEAAALVAAAMVAAVWEVAA